MTRYFLCLLVAVLVGCSSRLPEGHYRQPADAAQSLVSALRENDQAALKKIFGEQGDAILHSGDPVADKADTALFLKAYDEQNALAAQSKDKVVLTVGHDQWPFPVPIVKTDKGWVFDTAAGREELLNRRIGRNELDTIQVCLAVVDAQREYATLDPEKVGLPVYARKLMSDPGKKDGLFWPTRDGEPHSPLGPLVAAAADEGYGPATRPADGASAPYHGYRYRLLTRQGPAAKGGAMDYLVSDKLIGGFGLLAYPAEYGHSGVMTFIVNHDGVVYQKDLGPNTATAAKAIDSFNPDTGWTPVHKDHLATNN